MDRNEGHFPLWFTEKVIEEIKFLYNAGICFNIEINKLQEINEKKLPFR